MDEVDAVPRPRRQRPKDSFQNELQSKLRQRKSLGLSAEISDTDEESIDHDYSDYSTMKAGRPGSAKKRPDHSSSLKGGLGTTTMGSRDLTQMLGYGRGRYDDEDEEVVAANYGKLNSGRNWQSSGIKTPSPTQDARLSNRTSTLGSPKDQTGRLDSIFGKKTPTRETTSKSPQPGLSKEDIIFGRRNPSPADKRLPGVEGPGDKWQPPNFRSVSPSSSVEHSRGSRGVTPIDSMLGTISETPREKGSSQLSRGLSSEMSPRQANYGQVPKPQTRGLKGERKTPPVVGDRKTPPIAVDRKTPPISGERKTPPILTEARRRSPSQRGELDDQAKRTTPTLDLFGKSRATAAQELGSYIGPQDNYEQRDKKTEKQLGYSRSKTAMTGKESPSIRGRSSASSPTGRFSENLAKSHGKKKILENSSPERKSRETEKVSDKPGATLLDFLMDDGSANRPKPKERGRTSGDKEVNESQMFGSEKKTALRNKSPTGRRSPGHQRRKSQELDRGLSDIKVQPEDMFKPAPEQQRPEDTSSICEDIPADPNRKVARDAQQATKSGKQTTERAKADSAIDTIAEAQTMTYIEPAKKMRPFSASAKVQHRPKPRYGTLPGSKEPLQERNFNSTGDIRDAIYEEWYQERLKSARKKKKEDEKKKAKEEEEKKKREEEKRLEAEASYRAWMSKKKETLLIEKEKKEEEEAKKKENERQAAEDKKVQSIKSFQHWKQKKDDMIKRELHKKSEANEMEKEEKRLEKIRKQKERETAFRGWKQKKERVLQQQISEKRFEQKTLKQKEDEEKEEMQRKEMEATDRYYKWLEQKERQTKTEKRRAKQRRLMGEEDFKPAFRPASRTIPFGH